MQEYRFPSFQSTAMDRRMRELHTNNLRIVLRQPDDVAFTFLPKVVCKERIKFLFLIATKPLLLLLVML